MSTAAPRADTPPIAIAFSPGAPARIDLHPTALR